MPKNIIFVSVQKGHFALRTCKEPGSMQRRIMPSVQICGIRGYLSPWYRVCTNGMFRLKRSWGYAVPKNVILVSVQKAHFAVRTCKENCFMQRRIAPTVQICVNSGLAIAMVPCLHQFNVYIKRTFRVFTAQKCNPCFGAKTPLRSTDLKRTRFHAAPYNADCTNLRNSGLPIAMVSCLHQ